MSLSDSNTERLEESAEVGECRRLLQTAANSSGFQKSKRLRELLLYLGERALREPGAAIHEQEIAVDVFGRARDYENSQDTLVRVQASHLRKKLRLFFEEEGKDELLVIEIPPGGYTPLFRPRASKPLEEVAARRPWKTWLIAGGVMAALAAGCLVLWLQNRDLRHQAELGFGRRPSVDRLWRQIFGNGDTTYLVLSDASLVAFEDAVGRHLTLSEYQNKTFSRIADEIPDAPARALAQDVVARVTTSTVDAITADRLKTVAARSNLTVDILSARDLTSGGLSSHNSILLGSRRGNPWIGLFEEKLNFQTVFDEKLRKADFLNRNPKPGELPVYTSWPNGYCRVAYLPNMKGTGSVLLLSGNVIGSTEAGSEFITNEAWIRTLRAGMGLRETEPMPYFEVLLQGRHLSASLPEFTLAGWRRH